MHFSRTSLFAAFAASFLLVACGTDATENNFGGFTGGSGGSSNGGKSGSGGGGQGGGGSGNAASGGSDSLGGGSQGGLGGSAQAGMGGVSGIGGGGSGGAVGGASGSSGSSSGAAGQAGTMTGGSSGTAGAGAGGSGNFGGAAQGVGGGAAVAGSSGTAGSSGSDTCLEGAPNTDDDGDGFTEEEGDCRDCDANVHPGAINAPSYSPCAQGEAGCTCDANGMNCKKLVDPDPIDESCGHTPAATCGNGLTLTDVDATHAAWALDICANAATDGYGLVSARYVRSAANILNGATYTPGPNAGLTQTFGTSVVPFVGQTMLVLSSGNARDENDPGACGALTCSNVGAGTPPSGFPQDSGSCNQASNINDDIGLELRLRAPTNASGFKFRFRFYSFEYPEWVCTSYNDQFVALVNPPPAGASNGNISFDANGAPVSVNNALFDVTGGADLAGTGFGAWDDAGATQWLYTQSPLPVAPGQEFTITFVIWDTGDSAFDSTALIDGFEWIADGTVVNVGTGKEE